MFYQPSVKLRPAIIATQGFNQRDIGTEPLGLDSQQRKRQ